MNRIRETFTTRVSPARKFAILSKSISHQIAAIGMAIGETLQNMERAAAEPVAVSSVGHGALVGRLRTHTRRPNPFVERAVRGRSAICCGRPLWRARMGVDGGAPLYRCRHRFCCGSVAGLDRFGGSEYPPLRSRKHATARCVERTHCTSQDGPWRGPATARGAEGGHGTLCPGLRRQLAQRRQ